MPVFTRSTSIQACQRSPTSSHDTVPVMARTVNQTPFISAQTCRRRLCRRRMAGGGGALPIFTRPNSIPARQRRCNGEDLKFNPFSVQTCRRRLCCHRRSGGGGGRTYLFSLGLIYFSVQTCRRRLCCHRRSGGGGGRTYLFSLGLI